LQRKTTAPDQNIGIAATENHQLLKLDLLIFGPKDCKARGLNLVEGQLCAEVSHAVHESLGGANNLGAPVICYQDNAVLGGSKSKKQTPGSPKKARRPRRHVRSTSTTTTTKAKNKQTETTTGAVSTTQKTQTDEKTSTCTTDSTTAGTSMALSSPSSSGTTLVATTTRKATGKKDKAKATAKLRKSTKTSSRR
jgi:hypothetical protein